MRTTVDAPSFFLLWVAFLACSGKLFPFSVFRTCSRSIMCACAERPLLLGSGSKYSSRDVRFTLY